MVLGDGGVIIPQTVLPRIAPRPQLRPQQRPPPISVETVLEKSEMPLERKAIARPIDGLPDIYDLYDTENNMPISRASVQSFSLSQEMRKMTGNISVIIRWRVEFGGYEIARLAPNGI
jgi:hypothetical protein